METHFTKGPWTFSTEPQPNGCPIVGNDKGLMIAMLAHSINNPEQKDFALANAHLISCAPTMYEALKEYDEAFTEFIPEDQKSRMKMRQAVIKARSILAKARGEGV